MPRAAERSWSAAIAKLVTLRRVRLGAVAAFASVLLIAVVPASAAAARWKLVPMVTPSTVPLAQMDLSGVSCTSTTTCMAVGYYDDSVGGSLPLAELWNGSGWTIEPTPNRGYGSKLQDVSCTSSQWCMAVGTYAGGYLAEEWNGTTWSIVPLPSPAGGPTNVGLSGVSCYTNTQCLAVGETTSGAFAEVWSGDVSPVWRLVNPPQSVPGVGTFGFADATCTRGNPFSCWVVGGTCLTTPFVWSACGNGNDSYVLEYYQAPGLALAHVNLSDGLGVQAISCPSTASCMAVGANSSDAPVNHDWQPDAFAWQAFDATPTNPAGWTSQQLPVLDPSPSPGDSGQFWGVSCVSALSCAAVGTNPRGGTLAELWNASTSTWSVQTTPNPPGALLSPGDLFLHDVSCVFGMCMAVGEGTDGNGITTLFADQLGGP
jgi:hypothetical protein